MFEFYFAWFLHEAFTGGFGESVRLIALSATGTIVGNALFIGLTTAVWLIYRAKKKEVAHVE